MTMTRLTGLTRDELAAIGNPDELSAAINAELDGLRNDLMTDVHDWYSDEQIHAAVDARLAALPERGTERTAIQRTYELFLVIIDGGMAEVRSDHELLLLIDGDESGDFGLRPRLV
jgi:hypothetical protein